MRIALTGNPNSGKTTMYNALTGRSEKIGNWAGVTVDKKESQIKKMYCDGSKIRIDYFCIYYVPCILYFAVYTWYMACRYPGWMD